MKRISIQILAYVMVCCVSGTGLAAGNIEAGKTKSATCAGCHMPDGNSMNPEWPKLAGQSPGYLVRQLQAFKNGDRVNDVMEPFVKALSEQDIEDIAEYFGSQEITPGVAKAELMAVGEKLYKKGVFYTALTACTGCHGMDGQGNQIWEELMAAPPSVIAPAIGGQHATYMVKQMSAFKSGERNTDVGGVMRKIVQQMSTEQMEAVAQYITQLQ